MENCPDRPEEVCSRTLMLQRGVAFPCASDQREDDVMCAITSKRCDTWHELLAAAVVVGLALSRTP